MIGGQGQILVTIDADLRLPTWTRSVYAAPWVTSMRSAAKKSAIQWNVR